jgi:hypothetical protein
MTDWVSGGPRLTLPSRGVLEQDQLTLPNGQRICEVHDLASILIEAGIPGADASMGRHALAKLYGDFLERIGNMAATDRVYTWLRTGV